jgi:hypothetical protein
LNHITNTKKAQQMIQLAAALPELIKILTGIVENPDTYKKLEALRQLLEKLTGKEINQNEMIKFLEGATQGEPFTGKWEGPGSEDKEPATRFRIDGGWCYDPGRGNCFAVKD